MSATPDPTFAEGMAQAVAAATADLTPAMVVFLLLTMEQDGDAGPDMVTLRGPHDVELKVPRATFKAALRADMDRRLRKSARHEGRGT